jgi:hypothetical protein
MTNIKKYSDAKRSTVKKISTPSKKDKGEVVNIDQKINEKINNAIKKRLGSFVKEMQALKAKQERLEAFHKAGNPVGTSKKKKNSKNKKK